eukprot:TRINITY_DN108_c0_g1_i8.p1 TRINITY_DN108_c0_g1~~TRINITY_DN108_c0_g1_i8.p1  ORF type:complete len:231 (+),score=23.51 TRINITY_DN108_c0_g1_i8:550-1242(+)
MDIHLDSEQVMSAGEDGYIVVYSLSTLSVLHKIQASGDTVNVARFATHNLLYSSESGGTVGLWDLRVKTNKPVHHLCQHIQNQLSFKSTVLDIGVHPDRPFFCAAADSDGNLSLWDIRHVHDPNRTTRDNFTWPWKRLNSLHNGMISSVCFVYPSPNLILTGGEDGVLSVVDTETSPSRLKLMSYHNPSNFSSKKLIERTSSINDVALLGSRVLTANADESLSVLQLNLW